MPKNETGEFELVLGNRQLLSGFAVVAILFGVFFAMGYIVGRNSTPSARLLAADTQPAQTAPGNAVSQPGPGRAQQAPPPAEAAPTAPDPNAAAANPAQTPATLPPTQPQPTTQPARAPEAAKPPEKAAETPVPVQSVESLQAGTYLQVMAIKRVDAEVIVKALLAKGFPTFMTPSSIEGSFRVMVGPYKDGSSLGNAKTQLENSGFHPIVQKISDRT